MTSFDTLRDWLDAWYIRGDQHAVRRFVEHWLQPHVELSVRALALDADSAKDAAQEAMIRFLDREAARGDGALSLAFWRRRIAWLLGDWLRARGRLRDLAERQSPAGEDALDARADLTGARLEADAQRDAFDARFLAATGRALSGAWLRDRLAEMAPARRAYLLVYYRRVVGDLLGDADVMWMSEQTGRGPDDLRGALASIDGVDPRALLPLLFPASRLVDPDGVERCLDAFRKGRRRAQMELRAAMARSDTRPKEGTP